LEFGASSAFSAKLKKLFSAFCENPSTENSKFKCEVNDNYPYENRFYVPAGTYAPHQQGKLDPHPDG
jgi:hypothetical protein